MMPLFLISRIKKNGRVVYSLSIQSIIDLGLELIVVPKDRLSEYHSRNNPDKCGTIYEYFLENMEPNLKTFQTYTNNEPNFNYYLYSCSNGGNRDLGFLNPFKDYSDIFETDKYMEKMFKRSR